MDYVNASHITGDKSINPKNPGSIDVMDDDVKDDKENPARFFKHKIHHLSRTFAKHYSASPTNVT